MYWADPTLLNKPVIQKYLQACLFFIYFLLKQVFRVAEYQNFHRHRFFGKFIFVLSCLKRKYRFEVTPIIILLMQCIYYVGNCDRVGVPVGKNNKKLLYTGRQIISISTLSRQF